MIALIVFGAGVALGCFLKKPKVQGQPKFVVVDDRASLDMDSPKQQTQQVIKKYLDSKHRL